VRSTFHARHSAVAKTYEYRVFREAICPPFWPAMSRLPWPMDVEALQTSARLFRRPSTTSSASPLVSNQDELRRKLRRRGFEVTQATLSRDIHELRLSKGPGGYSLPNGNGNGGADGDRRRRQPALVAEMIESFGLRVRQAMNQVVVGTVMGGAQPVAAALDREGWPEVVGTIAGDDTVLVICPIRAGQAKWKPG
jgi:transcriptional regulator of arginine metabolism